MRGSYTPETRLSHRNDLKAVTGSCRSSTARPVTNKSDVCLLLDCCCCCCVVCASQPWPSWWFGLAPSTAACVTIASCSHGTWSHASLDPLARPTSSRRRRRSCAGWHVHGREIASDPKVDRYAHVGVRESTLGCATCHVRHSCSGQRQSRAPALQRAGAPHAARHICRACLECVVCAVASRAHCIIDSPRHVLV